MIASRVTPPAEVKRAEVDGAEGVGMAINSDHLKRNCASLRLTVPAFIAPMIGKGLEEGK